VATIIGWGVSDGETVDASSTRWATLTRTDLVGGSTPTSSVPGIFPAGGNPLQVTQKASPGMGVTVKAGVIAVPGNAGTVAPYGLVLDTNTDLVVTGADLTNPRIDLVIAKIYNPGTSSADGTIEILTGTAAPSPSRPTLPTGNYHCISIATIAVAASASSILNANISVAQSDTWSASTSDAGWTAAPGGCVVQAGLVAMSSTRRAAWAARLAPYTPWYDPTARVGGYTDGTDLVPTTIRKLFQVQGATTATSTSTSPTTVMTSGSLTVFGGTRRIRVTASGYVGNDSTAETAWISARPYLTGTGTITGITNTWTRAQIRSFGANSGSPTTWTRVPFTISHVFDAGAGTFSVRMDFIRETTGGTGSAGTTSYLSDGCLLVEDIGPA
jgi:hypothetical protein